MKTGILFLILLLAGFPSRAQPRPYRRLVLISDPHLPGRNKAMKEKALADINSWDDVDGVAVLGDLCADLGTAQEYAAAKTYLSRFRKPVYPIGGNHDYAYSLSTGNKDLANPVERAAALERLKTATGLPEVRYTLKLGRYRLLFASIDDLHYGEITALSTGTLAWMTRTLDADKDSPAVIFFHAPLEGTLQTKNSVSGQPRFEAQPRAEVRALLRAHRQVFLWASGHTHTAPTNEHFRDPANLYDGRVYDVYVPDLDGRSFLKAADPEPTTHDGAWSVSLYFYPDKVVVKTYDHRAKRWLNDLTREVRPTL